ncbi:MAG TPA: hypothetical protein VFS00_06400, partial [Polyangiaceae bacterium]|nr:hypothetical protein [Polyangiaceae bacterium]
MKRRVSWAFLACTMAIAPLALVGCGDDDDNPNNPAGSSGSAGGAGNAGASGAPAGGAGSAGSAGGAACVASEGLARTANQACADSQLVCKQTFTYPDAPGIREVQLQGALIPDTSWVTGAYMKKEGANWTVEV